MTRSIEQLRERARAHTRRLEAVNWLGVSELAARWGISPDVVREIPRDRLPYLPFGASFIRRYDPRDVESYEEREKRGGAVA